MNDYDPTRPFQSSEPDPSLEWEEDDGGPKLLWGRVLALFAVLLVAFLIGRASAPDDSAQLAELQEDLADAREQIEAFQEQTIPPIATDTPPDTNEDEDDVEPTDTPTDEETDEETDDGEGEVEGKSYTVKDGDNYYKISEKQFGDPAGGPCIEEANDGEGLDPGETITIPDSCDPG